MGCLTKTFRWSHAHPVTLGQHDITKETVPDIGNYCVNSRQEVILKYAVT